MGRALAAALGSDMEVFNAIFRSLKENLLSHKRHCARLWRLGRLARLGGA